MLSRYDDRVRTLCAVIGLLGVLSSLGCSRDPQAPGVDLAMATDDLGSPADLSASSDLSTALSTDLNGCTFQFGATSAYETSSGNQLAPRGGTTDAASVVTIRAAVPSTTIVPMTILYATGSASCTQANFANSVVMTSTAGGPGETEYSEYIPALSAGTHVCWKVAADTCGTRLFNPPPTLPSFDYTTQ